MADKVLKIDLHTHILPPSWPNLKEKFGYGGFISLHPVEGQPDKADMMKDETFFRTIDCNCWCPKARMKDLERTDVDVQVLSTVPVMFSYWAKPQDCLEVCHILNDHIAGICKEHPKHFVGLGTVPMQDPTLAIQELRRCMNELGMAGVEIGTHINKWNLDADELFPFFQEAEKLNAAIFVHPWAMMGQSDMPDYWLPWLVGMPAETSRAICSLIFGGVLERLPNLKVCFAHGGGSFPSTIGRIEHGFNVRPDLCAVKNKVNPREYLQKIYVDSLVHDEEVLRYLVKLFGDERIILGSDYPFPLGEHVPGKLILGTDGLSEVTKQRLLQDNALTFLNRNREDFL